MLGVQLEARVGDGLRAPLYNVRTLDALPWFVCFVALALLVGIEASRLRSGTTGLRYEVWGSIALLLVTAALVWSRLGALPGHYAKFVYNKTGDAYAFVHFDEVGIHVGAPKLHNTHHAWIFFQNYRFEQNKLILKAPGYKLTVSLQLASEDQHAQLRAGLARVFARPRVGPPIRIRECMGCGYDLRASSGPDCPECGRPFHKLNYADTRTTDLTNQAPDGK